MVEMKVKGLTLDPLTNMPIVILKDLEGKKALPIWVGIFEANAIALEMEQVTTPRPMTHDLIKNILEGLQARVNRVVVNDLKDNTFYAVISLTLNGTEILIDSRPSDAIALALRVNAPIFVEKKVIDEARSIDFTEQTAGKESEEESSEDWKKWLENLRPEDFKKYDT
jgi:bifunctional DNase/RNase